MSLNKFMNFIISPFKNYLMIDLGQALNSVGANSTVIDEIKLYPLLTIRKSGSEFLASFSFLLSLNFKMENHKRYASSKSKTDM